MSEGSWDEICRKMGKTGGRQAGRQEAGRRQAGGRLEEGHE